MNKKEAAAFEHAFATTHFLDEDDVCDEIPASVLCEDNYDTRRVWHLDAKEHQEYGDDFVDGVFVYAEKQGCITMEHSNYAYKNLNEMADEFRQAYGNYLPDDFDYVGHLCHFRGANFG